MKRAKTDERPWAVVDTTGQDTIERHTWFKHTAEDLARLLNTVQVPCRYKVVSRYATPAKR